jgi:membrane fusion protein (multidrug efflux system)
VQAAATQVERAWLNLHRTSVRAPVTGYVARRGVELGERVAPGNPLMSVVPLEHVWIDANFKEVQLRNMRIGQPVEVTADLYGGRVKYHGRVEGLGMGTGAAFALLPAQNATGNWIKIVQRLAVRIGLEPQELEAHPLFLGLSADINVDVTDQRGAALSKQPSWPAALDTNVYADQDAGADAAINEILAANLDHSELKASPPTAQRGSQRGRP